MKGKKKYIVPLLLAGVTATGVVATNFQQQATQVHAETSAITEIEGAELKFTPFQKDSYAVGDKVYLPEPTVEGGLESDEEIVYTVKKGNKTVIIKTDSEGDYFEANYEGYYNITVEVKKAGKVTSTIKDLSVWVEKEEAVINLPVNSEYVIPAKIPANLDGFKIPVPTVTKDVDGEEVEKTFSDTTDPLTVDELKVYLVTPTETVDLSSKLSTDKKYFAVDKTKLAETGTYQIVYEYLANESIISRLESNFQVVGNYDTTDIKLAMTFLDDVPATGNVNTDIKIPKVKVTDTNSNSTDAINAYVQVKVTNLKDASEVIEVDYENYTFRPTKEGYYTITYVASIPLYGDKIKTSEITPGDIIEVKDNQAPVVIPTYKYELTDGEISKVYVDGVAQTVTATADKTAREVAEEMLVNRKVDIPSVAVMKEVPKDGKTVKEAKVTIPAAYATDNFYTFKGVDNDEITITRTWRSSTGVVNKINVDPNLPAEITFTTKGNSEIRYKATDKAGNTLGEIVYDIVVYDGTDNDVVSDMKEGKTKVDLNVGTTVVSDREETLTFAKPTATDTYDKNVEVKTYVKVNGTETLVEDADYIKENGDGEYEINIAKMIASNESFDTFDIYAKAFVDSTLVGTRGTDSAKDQLVGTNVVTSKVTKVQLIKASEDQGAPEFSMAGAKTWNQVLFEDNATVIADEDGKSIGADGYLKDESNDYIAISPTVNKAPFDQGSTVVNLPAIKFSEDYDANLTISLSIKDQFGNDVSKASQETIRVESTGSGYDYYVEGASFKLSTYGVYTVTYTAKDIAGYITVKSFGIRVNDKTAPTITIDDEDKFGKEIEVGEYFKVPAARLVKNGETIDGTITWEIYKVSDGANYTKQPNGFTPVTEGTYFIRYHAVDENMNEAVLEDSMFTVTAKDSVAPTIQVDMTYRMPKAVKWNPADEDDDFMIIDIPVAFATDKLTKKDIEVIYTVTGPNGSKPTISDYEEEDKDHIKYFKATAEGVYTIKYSATDDAGNEKTHTVTIEVGDCEKPELTWVDKDSDLPTEVKLGDTYVLDLNKMINLSDNETSEADLFDKLTVSMTAPDGTTQNTTVKNGDEYEWKFTKSGNYTLKFTVKDKVGNSQTYSYTINVPAAEAEENKVSPVLGTVLVVLSVVVLSGVVIYFVASSKKKSTKGSKKNK